MSKRTNAHQKFARTLSRSLGLLKAYVELAQKNPDDVPHSSDMVRGAIVLAVAAMDAYFTDRFCETLVPFLKKHGPNERIVTLLDKAGLNTEQALLMASMQRPFRRIRTLVQRHLDRYVTQRFEAIDELFLCFGIRDLCKNVQGTLGKKRLLRSVEILVERRHQIVHDGDINDHGRLREVNPGSTLKRVGHLLEFVSAAEDLLNKAVKI